MRITRGVLALILALAVAQAEIAKLPSAYQSLVDLARAAPPEFTADSLLRIVEQGKFLDKDARIDLIEDAFRSASAAKFQVRMDGLPGTTTDTASGSLSRAYALKLDALSLESRAVRDMLPLDPVKARRMFTDIARPMLPALTCDDALFYDLSDYYQALSAVVNGAFSQKERAKDDHLNFLSDYLGQAASPLELAPVATVIESISVTNQQRQGLWAHLGGLMETIQADDRSLSAALPALTSMSLPEVQSSLEKYRQKNHGCEGDSAGSPANSKTSGAAAGASPKPRTPKLDSYWQSPNSQQLLDPGKKLRFDKNNLPLTDADRATPEYQQQVSDYLNQLGGWTPDQEISEADYYHEKCTVLMALIELVPLGPDSDKIIADYVNFVGSSNLYQQSPAEWYVEPRALLNRFQPGTLRTAILEAFQRSGNPVLGLEFTLEKASSRN
jgi:hypothetical protein